MLGLYVHRASLALATLLPIACAIGTDLSGSDGSGGSGTGGVADRGGKAQSGGTQTAVTSGAVTAVSTTGNGSAPSSTAAGNQGADCCMPSMTPSCGDAAIADCVCAQDDFCCTQAWDETCVSEVDAFGCGICGAGGLGGGDPGTGGGAQGTGACCMPTTTPGCPEDTMIQDCVCALDPYCCDTEWDDYCVAEVTDFGCGACQ